MERVLQLPPSRFGLPLVRFCVTVRVTDDDVVVAVGHAMVTRRVSEAAVD
jgi:hypothetical protein